MDHAASPNCGRISRELGVPAATVPRLAATAPVRAEEMRQHAMLQLGFIGGSDPALPVPSGSPLGDALSAVAACAHAAITSYGLSRANLWPAAGPLRPGPLPRAGARELKSRQPGDRHARALAATLTMTKDLESSGPGSMPPGRAWANTSAVVASRALRSSPAGPVASKPRDHQS